METNAADAWPERVFVCHSSLDASVAARLVTALESARIACWIAPRDVESGVPYPRQLVKAIIECRVFLLLVTNNSASSDHVVRELEQAVKHRRPILPVVVGGAMSADLDYYLGAVHQIHGSDADEVISLVEAYFAAPNRNPRPPSPLPAQPALPDKPQSRDTQALHVGVIPWPPFSMHAPPGGSPQGLFIDLLTRFGEVNNRDVQFTSISNEQSTRLVDEGLIDVVACLYRTPRRDRSYDFAACLYAGTMGAVVRASEERVTSFGDLMREEIRIVACQGEIGAELASDQFGARPGSARLVEMDTVNVRHIGILVAAGAADVAITDSLTCQLMLEEVGPVLRQAFPLFPLYVGHIGLLMSNGRTGLRDQLTADLRQLREGDDFRQLEREALAPFRGMLQAL